MSDTLVTIPFTAGTPAPQPAVAAPLAPAPATSGAASATQQVAPPPKDSFAPRKFTGPTPSSASPGIPELLRLVSTQPFYTVQNLATSHYIPNTINFFLILSMMDAQMVNTHKFTQSNPHWHPLISQLYISLLIYIHIIRCMLEADNTNVILHNFYDILYRHLGLDSLIIPGPLVPLFAAITYSSSPLEWVGNICPTLPANTGATARNGFRLNNLIYMVLPSILHTIDQIHNLNDLLANEQHYLANWNNTYYFFSRAVGALRTAEFNILTPNARYSTFVPFAAAQRFNSLLPALNIPGRLTASSTGSTEVLNYLQIFGFESIGNITGTNWLTTVGPIMSTYSTFMQGSVPLLSISPVGLGASLPVSIYSAHSAVVPNDIDEVGAVPATGTAGQQGYSAAVPAHMRRRHPSSNQVNINHSAATLSELAEQYSALSLVNADFTISAAASPAINGPATATLRTGHYWTLPTVRSAHDVNTQPGIANNIASYYHSAVPVRK